MELPNAGGVKYANLRGDLAGKGPYEAFVLFPAGADNPFHYHSQAIPTVVMQGTFYAVIDSSPLVVSTHLLVNLVGVEYGDNQRASIFWVIGLVFAMLFGAILFGVIPLRGIV
ncbi:hypothetical protein [Paracoccus marinaquae]|uniref:Uncharacterized protein n=1 Tax=Paracoccus marinaquae TaxID=2841926 RepID=A0ABS6ADV4_9RHOB|nr:hypothetical protein [Paracoccus marinaquae]MBU3028778.1 hypothetical protein [Paracoccus marinaquae]